MLFWPIFDNFWCPVVTLVAFSSNLSNFERNPKKPKKKEEEKKKKKISKKNPKKNQKSIKKQKNPKIVKNGFKKI